MPRSSNALRQPQGRRNTRRQSLYQGDDDTQHRQNLADRFSFHRRKVAYLLMSHRVAGAAHSGAGKWQMNAAVWTPCMLEMELAYASAMRVKHPQQSIYRFSSPCTGNSEATAAPHEQH